METSNWIINVKSLKSPAGLHPQQDERCEQVSFGYSSVREYLEEKFSEPSLSRVDILTGYFDLRALAMLWPQVRKWLKDSGHRLRILIGIKTDRLTARLLAPSNTSLVTQHMLPQITQDLEGGIIFTQEVVEDILNRIRQENSQIEIKIIKQEHLSKVIRDRHHSFAKSINIHSKMILFYKDEHPESILFGSANFTRPGLEHNIELNLLMPLEPQIGKCIFDLLWEAGGELEHPDHFVAQMKKHLEEEPALTIWSAREAVAPAVHAYLNMLTDEGSLRAKAEQIIQEKAGKEVFRFQVDAVVAGAHILDRWGGVILGDVVGLGKTLMASTLAAVLDLKPLVIAPPHLVDDWKEALHNAGVWHSEVWSIGTLQQAEFENESDPYYIEKLLDKAERGGFDTIIVDEAHRFRSEDTIQYQALDMLASGRKVILLSATIFNNSPLDVFSLLHLFQSGSLSDLLEGIGSTKEWKDVSENVIELSNEEEVSLNLLFSRLNMAFQDLSAMARGRKLDKRKEYGLGNKEGKELEEAARNKINLIAKLMKRILSKVMIRRNRLDIHNADGTAPYEDDYRKMEEKGMGFPAENNEVEEIKYEFSPDEADYYEDVLNFFLKKERSSFGLVLDKKDEDKKHTYQGALYYPERYVAKQEELAKGRQEQIAGFMRRLLAMRLESSRGAFVETLGRLLEYNFRVLKSISSTGAFIYNRKFMEMLLDKSGDDDEPIEILKEAEKLLDEIENGEREERQLRKIDIYGFKKKHIFLESEHERLDIKRIKNKKDFLLQAINDLVGYAQMARKAMDLGWIEKENPEVLDRIIENGKSIASRLNNEGLSPSEAIDIIAGVLPKSFGLRYSLEKPDPKVDAIIKEIIELQENEGRKVVLFSQYVETIKYFEKYVEHNAKNPARNWPENIKERFLFVPGTLNKDKRHAVKAAFDADYEEQDTKKAFLVTSDKLSEGVNLHRAGAVIHIDIPWNPVRVIQRFGRINRISKKVYAKLYSYVCIPVREKAPLRRALHKLWMIHSLLGEDARYISEMETIEPSNITSSLEEFINREMNQESEDSEAAKNQALRRWLDLVKKECRVGDEAARESQSTEKEPDKTLILPATDRTIKGQLITEGGTPTLYAIMKEANGELRIYRITATEPGELLNPGNNTVQIIPSLYDLVLPESEDSTNPFEKCLSEKEPAAPFSQMVVHAPSLIRGFDDRNLSDIIERMEGKKDKEEKKQKRGKRANDVIEEFRKAAKNISAKAAAFGYRDISNDLKKVITLLKKFTHYIDMGLTTKKQTHLVRNKTKLLHDGFLKALGISKTFKLDELREEHFESLSEVYDQTLKGEMHSLIRLLGIMQERLYEKYLGIISTFGVSMKQDPNWWIAIYVGPREWPVLEQPEI